MRRITSDGRIETFATRIPVPYFKYSYTRDFAARDEWHMVFTFGSKIYRYDDRSRPARRLDRPAGRRPAVREIGAQLDRYMGSLGVNFKYKRIAWAYKYDKRLLIADFEGHVRTLQFDNPGNAVAEGMSMDANTTHYWKLYPGENYLYLYYSGRTPMEVGAEQRRRQVLRIHRTVRLERQSRQAVPNRQLGLFCRGRIPQGVIRHLDHGRVSVREIRVAITFAGKPYVRQSFSVPFRTTRRCACTSPPRRNVCAPRCSSGGSVRSYPRRTSWRQHRPHPAP